MIVKSLLTISMLLLSGCAIVTGLSGALEEQEESVTLEEDRVQVFQDLLKQGWRIQVYKQKVLLIKETPDGFIINDVFSILKDK